MELINRFTMNISLDNICLKVYYLNIKKTYFALRNIPDETEGGKIL